MISHIEIKACKSRFIHSASETFNSVLRAQEYIHFNRAKNMSEIMSIDEIDMSIRDLHYICYIRIYTTHERSK